MHKHNLFNDISLNIFGPFPIQACQTMYICQNINHPAAKLFNTLNINTRTRKASCLRRSFCSAGTTSAGCDSFHCAWTVCAGTVCAGPSSRPPPQAPPQAPPAPLPLPSTRPPPRPPPRLHLLPPPCLPLARLLLPTSSHGLPAPEKNDSDGQHK